MPGALDVAVAATVAIIQILTFLCNGCITIGLIWSKQYRTCSNILILHLAVVDVCLSAGTLLVTVPSYVQEGWVDGEVECALYGGLTLFLHAIILWTICGLNYDKFSAICVPLSYNDSVTKWKTLVALCACWVLSACCALLPHAAGLVFRPRCGLCLPQFRRLHDGIFGILYVCGMLLLPAALIIFFNVRILIVARTQRNRIVSAIVSAVTMNARLAVPQTDVELAQRSRSPLGTTMNVLLPLLLMYLPFGSVVAWESVAGRSVDDRFVFVAHLLLCLSPIYGLIYGCRSKNLRRVFKNFVRKQLYKSEMQLEIQARAPRTCVHRPSIATQLTMQLPKHLQRRLSDAFTKAPSSRRRRRRRRRRPHSRLRRQASELTWAQMSHHLGQPAEPHRARSTDAIAAESDSSSGSPAAERSPASLAFDAAGLAERAFRFPATRPPPRSPLRIPHDEEGARAARGRLALEHAQRHRLTRSLSGPLNRSASTSPEAAERPGTTALPSPPSSPDSSGRVWLQQPADTSPEGGGSLSELAEPQPARDGRLWPVHSSASLAAPATLWRQSPPRRPPVLRAFSVEPQVV